MTRSQLEHLIRAAGAVTDENTILILGSQAILGTVEKPNPILARSMEADMFTLKDPDKMELINGSIGELSQFQSTFGYYAHGIPPEACPLPLGWKKRLQTIQNENTHRVMGLCLGAGDLAVSKLAAGREKDIEFVGAMLAEGVVKLGDLFNLIAELPAQFHESAIRSFNITCAKIGIGQPSPSDAGPKTQRSPSPKKPEAGPSIG